MVQSAVSNRSTHRSSGGPGGYTAPRPFRVDVSDEKLRDIYQRVAAYRHFPPPEGEGDDWSYGINSRWLEALCGYWLHEYDWRETERVLNRYPQFVAEIDGINTHYIHIRGEQTLPRPLLLLHGWPGSHFEFWKLADALAFPSRTGGSPEDGFDLVIPSLPGYGFSGPTTRPVGMRRSAEIINRLMVEVLGHTEYMVQGGDWGAVVGAWLGINHSAHCRALHVNLIGLRPVFGDSGAVGEEEEAIVSAMMFRERPYLAYAVQQGTRPQTLAISLMDSPVGTAAWIIDKFYNWSELGAGGIDQVYSRDELLTNVMIYLVNDTIASSLWSYRGMAEERIPFSSGVYCATPTALAKFPFEHVGATPPRTWVERYFNIVRWTEFDCGGHFAALEQPLLLLEDVRAFGKEAFPLR
jgi:pimeloyl-ACP methyl ester carboxylesterase